MDTTEAKARLAEAGLAIKLEQRLGNDTGTASPLKRRNSQRFRQGHLQRAGQE